MNPSTTQPKKILIVEDEGAIVRSMTLKLVSSNFDVTAAYNGADALAILQKGTFDLILLDLMMPKMDGFGVLEEMKARGDTTPVIVLTNLSQEEDKKRVEAYGARYFVKSNISLSQIVERIKEILTAQ